MDRVLSCECGREHRVSRSQAGQEIKCGCGKMVPVPTLRALADLPLAPSEPENSERTSTRGDSRGGWQGWRGITMAFAMAGFLIASIACGWFTMQRLRIDTSYTAEQEIAAGNDMLDNFDANTLGDVWATFNQMGMREKHHPYFFVAKLFAAEQVLLAQITGGIALAFAAIGLLLWLTTKKKAQET